MSAPSEAGHARTTQAMARIEVERWWEPFRNERADAIAEELVEGLLTGIRDAIANR